MCAFSLRIVITLQPWSIPSKQRSIKSSNVPFCQNNVNCISCYLLEQKQSLLEHFSPVGSELPSLEMSPRPSSARPVCNNGRFYSLNTCHNSLSISQHPLKGIVFTPKEIRVEGRCIVFWQACNPSSWLFYLVFCRTNNVSKDEQCLRQDFCNGDIVNSFFFVGSEKTWKLSRNLVCAFSISSSLLDFPSLSVDVYLKNFAASMADRWISWCKLLIEPLNPVVRPVRSVIEFQPRAPGSPTTHPFK